MNIRNREHLSHSDKKLVLQAIKEAQFSDIVDETKNIRYSRERETYRQAREIQDLGEGVINTSIGKIYAMADNE